MKANALTWLASLILCLGIGASGHLDAQDDHSAEWAQSKALQDAQRAAALLQKKERAALAVCRQTVGESSAAFDADDQLICTPKRGAAVRVAHTTTQAPIGNLISHTPSLATMALLAVVIVIALIGFVRLTNREIDELESALEQAQHEVDTRPRVGSVTNHMNDSGERFASALAPPRCSGGICRGNAACPDQLCPGHPINYRRIQPLR